MGIIVILKNGLNHLGMTSSWQTFVIGVVVILSIMVDVFLYNRKKRQEA